MKLNEIQLEPNFFFQVGKYCFIIIGVMNIANYFLFIQSHNIFSSVGAWAGIIFNFALAAFFQYMQNQSDVQTTSEYASDDVSDIINQIKNKEKQ